MNITQLRYFLKTAEVLNYSKAADALFIARQSLRQAIAAMEAEIGKPLFDNVRNKLTLTEYGTYLNTAGRDVLRAFDEMEQGLINLTAGSASLRIGFSMSLFPFILPDNEIILRSFRCRFPDIRLHVEQMENDAVIRAVMDAELDAGCVLQMPCRREGCRMHVLKEYEVALDYEDPMFFGGKRYLKPEDLEGVPCQGMGSLEISMQPLWELCEKNKIHFPYQKVPLTLDAFYQIKHGRAAGFDILKTNVPEFDWNRTSVLTGFHWELGFLCSERSENQGLLNLFFRFMEGEYTARWEQYDRLFARPEPSEGGALYLE